MTKRKLTLKRLDPWSVLKFGLVANLVGLGILLLAGRVVWYLVVDQLGLIDTICETAVEFDAVAECGINGGPLFRQALVIGLLGVVVLSGVQVFFSFLYNLIADLTGGLSFTFRDDTVGVVDTMTARGGASAPTGAGDPTAAREERLKEKEEAERERQRTAAKNRGTGRQPAGSSDPTVRDPRHTPAATTAGGGTFAAKGSGGADTTRATPPRSPERTAGRPEPTRSPLRDRSSERTPTPTPSAPTGAGDPTREPSTSSGAGEPSRTSSAPTGAGDSTRRREEPAPSSTPSEDREDVAKDRAVRERSRGSGRDDDPIFG